MLTQSRWLNLELNGSQFQLLDKASSYTFWLLFVPFLALVPLYMPLLERTLASPQTILPGRWSLFRRIWIGMRVAYGLVILSLIYLLSFFYYSRPLNDLDSDRVKAFVDPLLRLFGGSLDEFLNGSNIPSIVFRPDTIADLAPVAQLVLLPLFLLAIGGRAALFGLGLVATTVRSAAAGDYWVYFMRNVSSATYNSFLTNEEEIFLVSPLRRIPWLAVIIFAVLTAYPFVLQLVRRLTPARSVENVRWPCRRLALVLVVLASALLHLPPRWLLVGGGCLIFTAIGWLVVTGMRKLDPIRLFADWARSRPKLFIAALLVVSLVIVWPVPDPREMLRVDHLGQLMSRLDSLFIYILALALVLALREYSSRPGQNSVILGPLGYKAGILLFAVFLINSSTRWLFVPIPFLIGLLMVRLWLLRSASEMRALAPALLNSVGKRRRLIQDIIEANTAKAAFEAVQKVLRKKLEAAELSSQEYNDKLASYRHSLDQVLELEKVTDDYTARDIAFAVGKTQPWKNTMTVVTYGALLATGPLFIALYEFLPDSRVTYPYPMATLISFLVQSIVSWLLYAFFFGYFYVHLRGNSGLSKGINLFLGLVIPFAIYRLLSTETFEGMRPFFLWTAQIFVFCTLLGLLSTDYRLLRQNNFRGRDLMAVHNFGVLSVYGSSVIAAVTSSIIAIVSGRLGDVVRFFLDTVLSRGSPPGS